MKKKNVIIISSIIIISIGLFIGYGKELESIVKEKPIKVISGEVCNDGSPKEMHVFFACTKDGFDNMSKGYVIFCGDTVYCAEYYGNVKPRNLGTIEPGESVEVEIEIKN